MTNIEHSLQHLVRAAMCPWWLSKAIHTIPVHTSDRMPTPTPTPKPSQPFQPSLVPFKPCMARSLHFYASLRFPNWFQSVFAVFRSSLNLRSPSPSPSSDFCFIVAKMLCYCCCFSCSSPAAPPPLPAGILVFCRLTCWSSSSSSLAFCLQFALPIDKEAARRGDA